MPCMLLLWCMPLLRCARTCDGVESVHFVGVVVPLCGGGRRLVLTRSNGSGGGDDGSGSGRRRWRGR